MTNTTPPLVGLIGRKRSGKDTFAEELIRTQGFRRLAFADPLRAAALRLDPIVGRPPLPGDLHPAQDVRLSAAIDALGWERAKDLIPEVRLVLQRLGTDAIRTMAPTFWVDAATRELDLRRGGLGQSLVFTDVRFPNEADAIRDRGGVLVRLWRPTYVQDADAHPSETALDDYPDDWTVANDGTLADLRQMVHEFVLDLPRLSIRAHA